MMGLQSWEALHLHKLAHHLCTGKDTEFHKDAEESIRPPFATECIRFFVVRDCGEYACRYGGKNVNVKKARLLQNVS